jgi:hypothetical protein
MGKLSKKYFKTKIEKNLVFDYFMIFENIIYFPKVKAQLGERFRLP